MAGTHGKDIDALAILLADGYNQDVRSFTRGIENNPALVMAFERNFDSLNSEELIDWSGTNEQNAFQAEITDSCYALNEFLADFVSAQRYLGLFLDFINHSASITVEFGWLDATVGRVLWDRWTGHSDDPVIAYADIGFLFNHRNYRCGQPVKEIAEPPLYRYHPERFKAFHSCAEEIGKIYRHKVDPKSGMLTIDLLNEVMGVVVGDFQEKTTRYPRKLTLDAPNPSLAIESLESLATAYGRFVQAGRQIMDFPPALTEMLAQTDVDDIPLDAIKTPYASQYLYFGPQANLELESGWFVDGAYVEARGEPGDIRFTVTVVPMDHGLSRLWFVHPEPEYTQDFVGQFRKMDLATAMDMVLSDKLSGLNERIGNKGGDITSHVRDEFAVRGESMPENLSIVDISPKTSGVRLEQTGKRHPVFRNAIQLVVNALCYVTAYPDDIDTVWPEGTPSSLKVKTESSKGKEAQRAKSKLASLGYVPVHICGKKIEEQKIQAAAAAASNHGHSATHWRRGHWRNQVHGPGRMLRKLIWVMPALIGANHKEQDPEAGHLYLVS